MPKIYCCLKKKKTLVKIYLFMQCIIQLTIQKVTSWCTNMYQRENIKKCIVTAIKPTLNHFL